MNAEEEEDQGRRCEAEVKELARQQETTAYSRSPRQPPHSQSLNTNTTGNLAPSALHSTPAAKRKVGFAISYLDSTRVALGTSGSPLRQCTY